MKKQMQKSKELDKRINLTHDKILEEKYRHGNRILILHRYLLPELTVPAFYLYERQ